MFKVRVIGRSTLLTGTNMYLNINTFGLNITVQTVIILWLEWQHTSRDETQGRFYPKNALEVTHTTNENGERWKHLAEICPYTHRSLGVCLRTLTPLYGMFGRSRP